MFRAGRARVCSDPALKQYLLHLSSTQKLDFIVDEMLEHEDMLFVRDDDTMFTEVQDLVDAWHDINSFQPDPYAEHSTTGVSAADKRR